MPDPQQRMMALLNRLAPSEGSTLSALDGVKFMRVDTGSRVADRLARALWISSTRARMRALGHPATSAAVIICTSCAGQALARAEILTGFGKSPVAMSE